MPVEVYILEELRKNWAGSTVVNDLVYALIEWLSSRISKIHGYWLFFSRK